VPVTSIRLPLDDEQRARLGAVARRLSDGAGPPGEARFERRSSDEVLVEREPSEHGAFVVLSETWSLYEGWSARATGGGDRPLPVRRADGVVSAVWLRSGETGLEARYRPAGLGWMLAASGLGLLLALGLVCARRPTEGRR